MDYIPPSMKFESNYVYYCKRQANFTWKFLVHSFPKENERINENRLFYHWNRTLYEIRGWNEDFHKLPEFISN